jgi:tRNA 5-methylaminomethyl-2-thiouridine biosynthesis bifunctional protein
VPTQPGLAEVNTVLCARGYLTPAWEHIHCLGASYVKDPQSLSYNESEQQENLEKLQQSYPDTSWHRHLKMGQQARVGVRMVTRDHLPMAGAIPDVTAIYSQAKVIHDIDFWRKTKAPLHQGLYVLGALGSRGLCSAPLAAEMLAAELTHQPPPLSVTELEHLSANRKWMRKLLKGKEL